MKRVCSFGISLPSLQSCLFAAWWVGCISSWLPMTHRPHFLCRHIDSTPCLSRMQSCRESGGIYLSFTLGLLMFHCPVKMLKQSEEQSPIPP